MALAGMDSIQAVTRDVSSRGFYCWSPLWLAPGSEIVAILSVPAHSRERPECVLSIKCQVTIVRTEPSNQEGFYGLGCEISDYTLSHN
jgi:hypothetical protein